MGFLLLIVVAVLAIVIWKKVKERKEIGEFQAKVSGAYAGDTDAIRKLGIDFDCNCVPERIYGDIKSMVLEHDEFLARKYILYALAEKIDGKNFHLDGEIERGDYNTIDSVNLAREFVNVCYEKYGNKGMDKVLDTVLAKNLKIN